MMISLILSVYKYAPTYLHFHGQHLVSAIKVVTHIYLIKKNRIFAENY